MSKFKFELNKRGVRDLLRSEEMQSVLVAYATGIRERAGEGYEQDVRVGKNRANAMVWPESDKAKKDNWDNNTALKAVR